MFTLAYICGIRWEKKYRCEAPTEALLLKALENKLHQILEAEEEWEKQFQADAKSGWLDQLSEQAIQNYKAGKCYDLETIKKIIEYVLSP